MPNALMVPQYPDRMVPEELQAVRVMIAAVTPGPWTWEGWSSQAQIRLSTVGMGSLVVMAFDRRSAQADVLFALREKHESRWIGGRLVKAREHAVPVAVARPDFEAIALPDATFIAESRLWLHRLARHLRAIADDYFGNEYLPLHLRELLDVAEDLDGTATPGPWIWCGGSTRTWLATRDYGRSYIMGVDGWGRGKAQPSFRRAIVEGADPWQEAAIMQPATTWLSLGHDGDRIQDIRHPDARFIADAREEVEALLRAVDDITERIRKWATYDREIAA